MLQVKKIVITIKIRTRVFNLLHKKLTIISFTYYTANFL